MKKRIVYRSYSDTNSLGTSNLILKYNNKNSKR